MKYLELCKKYGARVIMGTDSHICYDIGVFQHAEQIIEEANFPKEWKNCYTYGLLVTKKRKYKWTEQHKYCAIFVCEGKENCE